jgi:hypothetical protein
MNRSILERELKKVRVSLKGWVPALECDDCKQIWQPFHAAVGATAPTAKLDYWRCPNNCNFTTEVSHEIQTALPRYVIINDVPGMIFGDEDLPEFERYVRSMDATEIANRGGE